MIDDIQKVLGAVGRSVARIEHAGGPARAVTLTRSYPTTIEDLWDAVTNPERLPRWFAPVDGDLRLGGTFQIKGNAGGEIVGCEAPSRLELTWVFGGDTSWVEVSLTVQGAEMTQLQLVHISRPNDHWEKFGPGATGVGWELGLFGLAQHLVRPETKTDPAAFFADPSVASFMKQSAAQWGEAAVAAGEDRSAARAAAQRTAAFFAGEAEPS